MNQSFTNQLVKALLSKPDIGEALERLDCEREALHLTEDVILSEPAQRIAGDTFRILLGFCVYVFWQQQIPLYVGYSNRGLNRASDPTHAAKEAIETCDQVHFYPCYDEQSARFLEIKLIRKLHPKYNIAGQAETRENGNISLHFGKFATRYG